MEKFNKANMEVYQMYLESNTFSVLSRKITSTILLPFSFTSLKYPSFKFNCEIFRFCIAEILLALSRNNSQSNLD